MSRVIGFVLLAVVVVVGAIVLFKKKAKPKTPCEQALQLGEKGVDAYYKTNSASIVDDSKDASLCKLAEAAAGAAAHTVQSAAGNHRTITTAATNLGKPAGAAAHFIHGDFEAGGQDLINMFTGANVINSLNYGTPIDQQSCGDLKSACSNEMSRPPYSNLAVAYRKGGPYCTAAKKKGCAV